MSNNIYDILGKLNGLVPKENPVSTSEPIYESVDPRGDIMEAVTGLEKKYAAFNENVIAEKIMLTINIKTIAFLLPNF